MEKQQKIRLEMQRVLVQRQSLPTNENIDGGNEIVTLSAEWEPNGFSEAKTILCAILCRVEEEIFLPRPRSAFDCTGQTFTAGLELVKRFIAGGYVHFVYEHSFSIDI